MFDVYHPFTPNEQANSHYRPECVTGSSSHQGPHSSFDAYAQRAARGFDALSVRTAAVNNSLPRSTVHFPVVSHTRRSLGAPLMFTAS